MASNFENVLPGAPEPTLSGPDLDFIEHANTARVGDSAAVDDGECSGGVVCVGWNGERRPPGEWPDALLFDRFKEARAHLECPSCLVMGQLNADGRVKGQRRVKCTAVDCGRSMSMVGLLAKFAKAGRKSVTPATSRPPAKVRQVAKNGKKLAGGSKEIAEEAEAGDELEAGDIGMELEADELVKEEHVVWDYSEQDLGTVEVAEDPQMDSFYDWHESVEQRLSVLEAEVRDQHGTIVTLECENVALKRENQEIKRELAWLRDKVEQLVSGRQVPAMTYASVSAGLPSAASPVNVVARSGEWSTVVRRKEPAAGSQALLEAVSQQMEDVRAGNRFEPLAHVPEPAFKVAPRQKMTFDEARRIMMGKGLNKRRPVVTIIGAGVNGTVLKANSPKKYRQMLRDVCDVDLRRVFSLGWIGKSAMEVQLDADYVDTFKALLKNGRIDVDWIVDADPLSAAMFKRGPLSEGGDEAVREAGRKYKARLEDRLKTAVVDSHQRYLKEELIRAEEQIKSGVFVPRVRGPSPMEGVHHAVDPMETVMMDGTDPASSEGPGSPQ
jgi:hypothetical protein